MQKIEYSLIIFLVYKINSDMLSSDTFAEVPGFKDTPTCLHTMYAENQTKWLSEYLQAELTIVSTSQTKHLIPCFQYQFDIQQYSTTPGGQC